MTDTTSLPWALELVRALTRDETTPYDRADTLIESLLEARAHDVNDTLYYRPHVVAASLLRTDPDRAQQESIDNAQKSYRSPDAVARSILTDYAWVDDLIGAQSGTRPPSGLTARLVF